MHADLDQCNREGDAEKCDEDARDGKLQNAPEEVGWRFDRRLRCERRRIIAQSRVGGTGKPQRVFAR